MTLTTLLVLVITFISVRGWVHTYIFKKDGYHFGGMILFFQMAINFAMYFIWITNY